MGKEIIAVSAALGLCVVLYIVFKRRSSSPKSPKKDTTPAVVLTQPSEEGKTVKLLHESVDISQKGSPQENLNQPTAKKRYKCSQKQQGDGDKSVTASCTKAEKDSMGADSHKDSKEIEEEEIICSKTVTVCQATSVSRPKAEYSNTEVNVVERNSKELKINCQSSVVQEQRTSDSACPNETNGTVNNATESDTAKESSNKCEPNNNQNKPSTINGEVNGEIDPSVASPAAAASSEGDASELDRSRSQSGNGHLSDQCHSSDSGVSEPSEAETSLASPQVKSKTSTTDGQGPTPPSSQDCFEFDFPSRLCGVLIGSKGKHIKNVMNRSGANVVLRNKMYDRDYQICTITGTPEQVREALRMIKNKFPPKKTGVDYSPSKPEHPVLSPEMMQLHLPEEVTVDVLVSSVVTANHVFLQQPTHPSFHLLERQNQVMSLCYGQPQAVPELPRPMEVGVICAAPMFNGWYRGQVVQTYPEQDECDVRFVDYGGYIRTPGNAIRQIRSDFTVLPFQAVECYLANVIPPNDEQEFSNEANAILEQMVQGQFLQAQVVALESDGVPYVQLYTVNGDKVIYVNRELVNKGVAQWVETA